MAILILKYSRSLLLYLDNPVIIRIRLIKTSPLKPNTVVILFKHSNHGDDNPINTNDSNK